MRSFNWRSQRAFLFLGHQMAIIFFWYFIPWLPHHPCSWFSPCIFAYCLPFTCCSPSSRLSNIKVYYEPLFSQPSFFKQLLMKYIYSYIFNFHSVNNIIKCIFLLTFLNIEHISDFNSFTSGISNSTCLHLSESDQRYRTLRRLYAYDFFQRLDFFLCVEVGGRFLKDCGLHIKFLNL